MNYAEIIKTKRIDLMTYILHFDKKIEIAENRANAVSIVL